MTEPPTAAGLARSEARAVRSLMVSFHRVVDPGVRWRSLDSGVLVAMGPGRYVNRGVGVGPELSTADIDEIVRFYTAAGLPAMVQLSSQAGEETLERLRGAEFTPRWFRSVHGCRLAAMAPDLAGPKAEDVQFVVVDDSNLERWLDVLAAGNEIVSREAKARSDEYALAAHRAEGATDFMVFHRDHAVGCGSIQRDGETAWFGGAATVPSARGWGVQRELLRHRLAVAVDLGCSVVAATATPGGVSARNLVRVGLDLIDVQLVLARPEGDHEPLAGGH